MGGGGGGGGEGRGVPAVRELITRQGPAVPFLDTLYPVLGRGSPSTLAASSGSE